MEQPKLGDATPAPKSKLRLVDEHGELHEKDCPGCRARDEEIRGLETEKRGWRTRFYNLERELHGGWQEHDLFPAGKRIFDFWRERCNHPASDFTPDRFKLCVPALRDLGEELCLRAIEGAAFDPYVTQRKNGSANRHDAWDLIFRSRDKVEEFANRAPYHLPSPERVKTLADALAWIYGWEPDRAVAEAQERLKR